MNRIHEKDEALQIISLVINYGFADISMIVMYIGVPECVIHERISVANIILNECDAGKLVISPAFGIVLNGDEEQRGHAFDLLYKNEFSVPVFSTENRGLYNRRSNYIRHDIK